MDSAGEAVGLLASLYETYEAQPFSSEDGAFRGGRPMAADGVLDVLRLHLHNTAHGQCSGTAHGHILTVQCGSEPGWRIVPREMAETVDRGAHSLQQAGIHVLRGRQSGTGVRLYAVPDDPGVVQVRPVVDGLERLPMGGHTFNARRQQWVRLMASARTVLSGNGWESCGETPDGRRFAVRPEPIELAGSGRLQAVPRLAAEYELETRWPHSDWAAQSRVPASSVLKAVHFCLRKGIGTAETVGSTIYLTSITASDFAPSSRYTPAPQPEPARAA
ncbi:hypothetical protein [Streptomyces sp. NBC_00582]|uniref:hypothetical protein n=1 Tax=Streptomyces sp. NBC_00582 TaxID=2975783 RepID=UPI002E80A10B|nr:hypothetical protein [Streptomyces sp. NBC_00582]WUB68328.1 hypothetical protein OG852_49345 [Streptomyces sp. NBC_00582]